MFKRYADITNANIQGSDIMVPTDIQNRYKAPLTLYSGTVTANGNSADVDVSPFSVLEVEIKVTSVSGTTPTLSVYIEGKFENTGDYKTIVSQENITGAGIWFATINPCAFRYVRVRWVVGGTSPSFTFRVDAQGMV
jgi:putative transposon-encoded protein